MMKNAYFILKTLFVIKIDVTTWLTNKCNTHINQKRRFGQLVEYNMRNIFLQISCTKLGRETSFILLFVFKKASCKQKSIKKF